MAICLEMHSLHIKDLHNIYAPEAIVLGLLHFLLKVIRLFMTGLMLSLIGYLDGLVY